MIVNENAADAAQPKVMKVAVMGSGTGSTARALIEGGLKKGSAYHVELIISTSTKAGINTVATDNAVTLTVLDQSLSTSDAVDQIISVLISRKIDIVALAGYMRLLPESVINAVHGKVLNIHPALLPKYGGVGMYGRRVHDAVIQAGEKESGASVHLVDGIYDNGRVLGQVRLTIGSDETASELESRVKEAERTLYPAVLQAYASDQSFHVGNW